MNTGLQNRLVMALVLAIAVATLSLSSDDARAGEINADSDNVAIKGYDSVAYFTMNEPIQGSEDFSYSWLGTTWLFANEEHRDAFVGEPIKYAPQYGGYCAIGVSMGRRITDIDPEAWRIVDGKLYLNYGPDLQGDPKEMVARADANWKRYKKYFTGE